MLIYLHMPTTRNNRAFTIVELLVVITVMGILVSVALISYVGVSAKAKTTMVESDLKNTSRQIDLYQVENSQYPTTTSVLNDDKGLTLSPSDTLLSYTFDNAANYYCLTMESGAVVTSIKNSAPPVNGYCMQNLVKNGDFSNGLTNWKTEDIGGTFSAVGGVAQNVSDGTDTSQLIWQSIATTDMSHKFYLRNEFKSVGYSASVMHHAGCGYSESAGQNICVQYGYSTAYAQNTWKSFSTVYTPFGPQDVYIFFLTNAAHTTLPSGMISQFDNAVMIDLTATFGAGNEPTQAAMDTMLAAYPTKWFEGTVIVNK